MNGCFALLSFSVFSLSLSHSRRRGYRILPALSTFRCMLIRPTARFPRFGVSSDTTSQTTPTLRTGKSFLANFRRLAPPRSLEIVDLSTGLTQGVLAHFRIDPIAPMNLPLGKNPDRHSLFRLNRSNSCKKKDSYNFSTHTRVGDRTWIDTTEVWIAAAGVSLVRLT